jgi:hypothetical protein
MTSAENRVALSDLTRFDRKFFNSSDRFTYISSGELGGKALGLASIDRFLKTRFDHEEFPQIEVSIPTLTVITTEMFDKFMSQNDLYEVALSERRDDQIALAFQQASLPAELVGDLRALISQVKQPLAVRSSSLAEDAMHMAFAGVYGTKMIPNNQHDIDSRYRVLMEAIKFVYASTFFGGAKRYMQAAGKQITDEKMAVVIQEVVGRRFNDHFYPQISGVARTYNYYPTGHAKPEEGVVNLALGLGKTIVDGGVSWIYSPKYPQTYPPHDSVGALLKQTQTTFWAVNMGPAPVHDPIKETEYLVKGSLQDAERDNSLRFLASTYSPERDRLIMGTGPRGPRVLTMAPALQTAEIPINEVVIRLLKICELACASEAEMEFAVTLDHRNGLPARFGVLQMRPMLVSDERVEVEPEELGGKRVLAASEQVMGNGVDRTVTDIIYVKPDVFEAKNTRVIAGELADLNRKLLDEGRRCLLLVFGRLGSQDPWLGIPVEWAQVSSARIVVEATLPGMDVDLSQGAHFFHNVVSFGVLYFSVHHAGKYPINWRLLREQKLHCETEYVSWVRLDSPANVKVDGRSRRGVIVI